MMTTIVTEGEIPFDVPAAGKECKTWYKIVGDLKGNAASSTPGSSSGAKVPLIILHGGPGLGHNYLLPLTKLGEDFGVPIIFYDQLGVGNSTHLREKAGDDSFWTPQLFVDELANLVRHFGLEDTGYDILGHSWGGLLASSYIITTQAKGLRRLILYSTLSDVGDSDVATQALLSRMPKEIRETIEREEREGRVGSPEHKEAAKAFSAKHYCNIQPYPCPEVKSGIENVAQDPTVFMTMRGTAVLHISGNLKGLSIKSKLDKIKVPTLLINGSDDKATDGVMMPFFEKIDKVKWLTIDGASHHPHLEKPEMFVDVVSRFLLAESI